MNVHETVVKIADDLYVAGFGGSIPAVDQDRHIIWSGFPQTKGDFDISRMRELIQDLPETSSVRELVFFPRSLSYFSTVLLQWLLQVLYITRRRRRGFTREADS